MSRASGTSGDNKLHKHACLAFNSEGGSIDKKQANYTHVLDMQSNTLDIDSLMKGGGRGDRESKMVANQLKTYLLYEASSSREYT